jgi:tRNA 2-thiouridine synthesizing protein A
MSMRSDATLDCVGLYCPIPIAETAKKLKELEVGQVLEILADDDGIKEDMPAWCRTTGNELLGIEEEAGQYKAYVKKSQ